MSLSPRSGVCCSHATGCGCLEFVTLFVFRELFPTQVKAWIERLLVKQVNFTSVAKSSLTLTIRHGPLQLEGTHCHQFAVLLQRYME